MITIQSFTFSPFAENTYILFDHTLDCVLIDPGNYNEVETQETEQFLKEHGLKLTKILQTHCHLDHIFGSSYFQNKYQVEVYANKKESFNIEGAQAAAMMFGLPPFDTPVINQFFHEGDKVEFGESTLQILDVPGHSPGHVAFVCPEEEFVIAGDVLFAGGIGRTDLPGGSFEVLEESIKTKLYPLPDGFTVYPGHGPSTTIANEKSTNPFVRP